MLCITLTEPWATLIAISAKTIETRGWRTAYRGPLAIHAAKKLTGAAIDCFEGSPRMQEAFARAGIVTAWDGYRPRVKDAFAGTRGRVLATCTLVGCVPTEMLAQGTVANWLTPDEMEFGDFDPGRFAWLLDDIERLPEPIPARGALGLWEWEAAS